MNINAGLKELRVASARVWVEEAITPEQKAKGLGERSSLAKDQGMIFPFDPPQKPDFWMKGMRFPLDFIWIRDDKVVDITEHVAAPLSSMTNTQLPHYFPNDDIDTVLEVNAGFVEYYKIKIGDEVTGL